MSQQIPIDSTARADSPTSVGAPGLHAVAADLAYQRLAIVNVVFIGLPNSSEWVLVDTGVFGSAGFIQSAADARFGKDAKPVAIIQTHGHFDHTGVLRTLAERWNVPIYAHELELPYLNGSASYPPPDPGVGGGLMATLASFYPRGPVDVSHWLKVLPSDGSIPPLPEWKWLLVPGHTPGQIALWRERDRSLIAADAFVTTAQESVYAVAMQEPELHGPPMYYTQDWVASKASVQKLASLEPELAITGHGRPMHGAALREALHALAKQFDEVAVPKQGKYVMHPAHAEDGSAYTPAT